MCPPERIMAWIAISIPLVLLALAAATVPLIWGTFRHSREEPARAVSVPTIDRPSMSRSGRAAA